MTRSKWTLALLAAAGVALYRKTRLGRSPTAAAPTLNLAGSGDLSLPPVGGGVVPETMWTPSDPTDAPTAAGHQVSASREP